MKKVWIIFIIGIIAFTCAISIALIYPMPSTLSISHAVYDETYFIDKISTSNFQIFKHNKFEITEEELNGYIAYKLNQDHSFSSISKHFQIKHVNLNLMENQIHVQVYGNIKIFPVKIEVHFTPFYKDNSIYAIVEGIKFSRVNVPHRIVRRFVENPIQSKGDSHFQSDIVIPLETSDVITIHEMVFAENKIIIDYSIYKEKLLEKLIQEFLSKFR